MGSSKPNIFSYCSVTSNGAGKSTTIETMVGLLSREGGQIDIFGFDPEKDKEKLQEKIGIQLQSPAFFDKLTVKEMVLLFASFYNNPFTYLADLLRQVMIGVPGKFSPTVNILVLSSWLVFTFIIIVKFWRWE